MWCYVSWGIDTYNTGIFFHFCLCECDDAPLVLRAAAEFTWTGNFPVNEVSWATGFWTWCHCADTDAYLLSATMANGRLSILQVSDSLLKLHEWRDSDGKILNSSTLSRTVWVCISMEFFKVWWLVRVDPIHSLLRKGTRTSIRSFRPRSVYNIQN